MKASLENPDAPTDSSIASLLNDDADFDQAARGFALATLEFIAMAARRPELRTECAKRIDLAVGGYSAMAELMGASSSDLTARETGALFFARDQGAAIMTLAGSSNIREHPLDKGLATLLRLGSGDGAAVEYDEVRKNITSNLASGHPAAAAKPDTTG